VLQRRNMSDLDLSPFFVLESVAVVAGYGERAIPSRTARFRLQVGDLGRCHR
jgi:hypothetical protein